MSDDTPAPPVLLIHGLWMSAASWDGWVARYRDRGLQVLAPSWPRMGAPVEALRADTTP